MLGKGPGENASAGFTNRPVIPIDTDPVEPAAGGLAPENKAAQIFFLKRFQPDQVAKQTGTDTDFYGRQHKILRFF